VEQLSYYEPIIGYLVNERIAFVKKWIAIQQKDIQEKVIEKNLRDLTAGYVAITDTLLQFNSRES